MANIQIPNLTAAVGLTGDEQFEVVQASESKRVNLTQIALFSTFGSGAPALGDIEYILGLNSSNVVVKETPADVFTALVGPLPSGALVGTTDTQTLTNKSLVDASTYIIDDVVHYCVANMPGAVPFTSTVALTNATLPYAVEIANKGITKALSTSREIRLGLNMLDGKIMYKGVADAFGLPWEQVSTL